MTSEHITPELQAEILERLGFKFINSFPPTSPALETELKKQIKLHLVGNVDVIHRRGDGATEHQVDVYACDGVSTAKASEELQALIDFFKIDINALRIV